MKVLGETQVPALNTWSSEAWLKTAREVVTARTEWTLMEEVNEAPCNKNE